MNPKQIVMNMMKNNSNPIFSNLIKLAETNDVKGLESFARNMCKEQGKDFDKEIANFQNMFMKKEN